LVLANDQIQQDFAPLSVSPRRTSSDASSS
jgi:hypothetical protein